MATRATCWGGPYDGLTVSGRTRATQWAWVAADGRIFTAPSRGRFLYKAEKVGNRRVWRWVGHRVFRCDNCGAYHQKVEGGAERPACHLCGERTEASA